MKTWNKFLEDKNEANAQLAPMSQQPKTAGMRMPVARRSATLNLTPAQQQQGAQAYQQAGQQQPPVSDEEMGQAYGKSMDIQQQMARAQMGRRV